MRAYDQYAIDRCAVPGLLLMENAGRGAAEHIAELAIKLGGEGPIVIVCGRGNNGGDGFVVARHLAAQRFSVKVFLVGRADQISGDARSNLDSWMGLGGTVACIEEELGELRHDLAGAPLSIDALFGTGLSRPIQGIWLEVIDALNSASCPCVALDIPSGIDANNGQVLGTAVQACATLSFAHYKAGLFQGAGPEHAGLLRRISLGIPDDNIIAHVGQLAEIISPVQVASTVGTRAANTHKYHAGSVLVLAGSAGKTGAAQLCAKAALRSGAGLLTLASWTDCLPQFQDLSPEVMTAALNPKHATGQLPALLEKKRAVAIGPGLGLDEKAHAVVEYVALQASMPVVIDADGITLFADRPEALRQAAGPRVLTPHSGELARLLSTSSADIEANRFAAAQQAAQATGCTVVLKGPNTIVAAPSNTMRMCDRGNAALATAGSGDVLTGILAALLCNAPPLNAASAAVFLHAITADQWRERTAADRGMLAGDIIDAIPQAIASLNEV